MPWFSFDASTSHPDTAGAAPKSVFGASADRLGA